MLGESSFLFAGPIPVFFPRPTPLLPFVAILIDGDNKILSEVQLVEIIHEAEKLGEVVVRRVYGNWAATIQSDWKDLVLKYAFTPCHHIHGTPGKNATDIALTVATMDLFYQGVTLFFLVSGDSDYTPLIQRLRASNCQVIGAGQPTPSLVAACNDFIPLLPASKKLARPAAMPKKESPIQKALCTKEPPVFPSVGIFINGENQPPSQLEMVLLIASFLGTVLICRIYCANASRTWQRACHKYNVELIARKGTVDLLFAVEAQIKMLQVFLLVSDTDDFAEAAHRLQQYGTVIGLGSAQTSRHFQDACPSFVPLPTPTDDASLARLFCLEQAPKVSDSILQQDIKKAASTPPKPAKGVKPLDDPELIKKVEQAFAAIKAQQESEVVLLVDVAKALKEQSPEIHPKEYGQKSVLFLVKAMTDLFTFQPIKTDGITIDEMRRRK